LIAVFQSCNHAPLALPTAGGVSELAYQALLLARCLVLLGQRMLGDGRALKEEGGVLLQADDVVDVPGIEETQRLRRGTWRGVRADHLLDAARDHDA